MYPRSVVWFSIVPPESHTRFRDLQEHPRPSNEFQASGPVLANEQCTLGRPRHSRAIAAVPFLRGRRQDKAPRGRSLDRERKTNRRPEQQDIRVAKRTLEAGMIDTPTMPKPSVVLYASLSL